MKKAFIFTVMLICALALGFSQQISSINIFNGNGYEVVNQTVSWEEARREAERRGGKLAAINSAEENTFVFNLIMRQGNTDFYWLGGQADSGRRWSWVTGESFSYTNWGNGNPDNYEGQQDKIKMSRAYYTWSGHGEWDDDNNNSQYGFVIEYPTGAFTQVADTIVQGSNLAEKLDWLKVFAQNNTNYIVEVRANESINGLLTYGDKNIIITLRGVGANRTITGLSVGSGVTLILDNNITLSISSVTRGSSLIMNNGATLNTITGQLAEISVRENGIFIMNGGTISGKRVSVSSGSTFIMNGGTISGSSSCGVSVENRGTFIMNGGTISDNTSSSFYKDGYGGGVYVEGGIFTMNGGTISGNNATARRSGYSYSGGGVYVCKGSTFTMNGGTISGNTADDGGGVCVSAVNYNAIFFMRNGTISGNTALQSGGGVVVSAYRGAGYFEMSGGTISGNTARENGGGVYVGGTFTKTGGTISGYASDQRNGNVVKNDSGAVQNFRGHAVYANVRDLLKIRQGTAGPEDNLSYNTAYNNTTNPPTVDGAWDN